MRHEIPFTDDEIVEHFDQACFHSKTLADVTFTRRTLDDHINDRQQWVQAGSLTRETVAGVAVLVFTNVQVALRQRRVDVIVIDYGSARAVLYA